MELARREKDKHLANGNLAHGGARWEQHKQRLHQSSLR